MIGDIYEGHLISNNHSAMTKTRCVTPLQICAIYTKRKEKDGTCIFKKFIKTYTILVGNLKERDHSENLDADGSIVMKWILQKQGFRM
jgi:hypothetical protein